MKVDVLLGLQWGDEGKGKVVDVLAPRYDVIARFQGGPNAGHTLEFEGIKHVLHTIPSGIFHPGKINIIGNGVVIDPVIFKREVDALIAMGVDISKNLFISRKAHLILPTHRMLDAASEAIKGKSKIGSTLKGIGPAYMDKTGRNGLRVGDIENSNFNQRYDALVAKHNELLAFYHFENPLSDYEKGFMEGIEMISKMNLIDSEYVINGFLEKGKSVLAEGAQGSLLDIDFGSYPFVTSSNTITAGTCTGLGVAPSRIGEVYGIFKAYCTRVGGGPFPTELENEIGDRINLILNLLNQIELLDTERTINIKNRIKNNLSEIIGSEKIDENRFEQELIYYIEKLDITEEKTRLKTHCNFFLENMNEASTGRKLAFISQEIGREINTIGSKANNAPIQKIVVLMKDELEKIKEQLNNIL